MNLFSGASTLILFSCEVLGAKPVGRRCSREGEEIHFHVAVKVMWCDDGINNEQRVRTAAKSLPKSTKVYRVTFCRVFEQLFAFNHICVMSLYIMITVCQVFCNLMPRHV